MIYILVGLGAIIGGITLMVLLGYLIDSLLSGYFSFDSSDFGEYFFIGIFVCFCLAILCAFAYVIGELILK